MIEGLIQSITPHEASELLERKDEVYTLLDVRTTGEFSSLHAAPATNIPLHMLTSGAIQQLKGKKVICICQKGARGEQAARTLSGAGLTDVFNIQGGTEAWESAGLPVLRGQSTISLDRQVRVAAGSLVTIGVLAGYFITPYAFLLSLFVGCGLVFAGVTNTCGMAMLLARCPWNNR